MVCIYIYISDHPTKKYLMQLMWGDVYRRNWRIKKKTKKKKKRRWWRWWKTRISFLSLCFFYYSLFFKTLHEELYGMNPLHVYGDKQETTFFLSLFIYFSLVCTRALWNIQHLPRNAVIYNLCIDCPLSWENFLFKKIINKWLSIGEIFKERLLLWWQWYDK